MKRILLSMCALCTMLPNLVLAQNATRTSSHHQLGSEINYPVNHVSPNGRYMGGWLSGVTNIYDTEANQTVITLGNSDTPVYLVAINEDGSFWASRVTTSGIKYGLYKDGEWTDLPKPDGFEGGWLRHVTADGKYAVNSYTNMLPDFTLISDAFLYERQEDGTYQYRKLVKPQHDCWTESEVFHVDPMAVSQDGSVVLGHMVDGLSKFVFPIVWKRNAQDEYEYQIKGEALCFNLDLPSPGNPPVQEEIVTAEEGTPEYNQQMAQYEAAVQEWNTLASAFFTGQAINGYPIMDNHGKVIGANLFTGDPNKGSQPLLLSVEDDSYTLVEYFMTKTYLVADNGTAFLVNEFIDGINHNVVYTPGVAEPVAFDKWLKAEYGLTLEPMYSDGLRVTVGNPALSYDGKTLAFTLKTPSNQYKNHYYRLDKTLNTPTSVETPLQNNVFRVYTNGKMLYINEDRPCDVRIIDMNGKSPVQATAVANSLNLEHLNTGVYIAAVTREGKTEFFKIVLTH